MIQRVQPARLFRRRNRRQDKRERMLRKMAAMRFAKARRRLANPPEHEPRMIRTTGLSFAIRDDLTGVVVWAPLRSVRDTTRRVAVVLREYRPGLPVGN